MVAQIERSVKIQRLTSASQIKRQWQHQTKILRARNVKDQDFQEITQSTAAPARRSGAVPVGSPFSLYRLFMAFPSLETAVTRLARALLVYT
jgi:hypothetical protein